MVDDVIYDEVQHRPSDDMPPWVCAVGGYEFLLSPNPDVVRAAIEWSMRFGDGHKPIKGSGLEVLRRYHGAQHYGFAWWGDPREMIALALIRHAAAFVAPKPWQEMK